MKRLVKRLFRKLSGSGDPPVARRILVHAKKRKGMYFSRGRIDWKLEKYLDYRDGFFVELGANDGVRESNTLHLELTRGWRGVLVEPAPHNFLRCRKNRSPENHIFCNACVGFDYAGKYVDLRYADLMTISANLDLDLPDADAHIEKGRKYLKKTEETFAFGAVAAPLTELLDRAGAPKEIDLLSLDVEGAELDVLRGIDFSRYRFRYMVIEIRDLPRIEEFLGRHGYKCLDKLTVHDYLFVPRDA